MRRSAVALALLCSALSARAGAQPSPDAPPASPPPPDAPAAAQIPPPPVQPLGTPNRPEVPGLAEAPKSEVAHPSDAPAAPASPAAQPTAWQLPHWDKGFVLVSAPPGSSMPFRLRLNHVSQFKYTNSLATNKTYTDHMGVEHDVQRRNDIQLTRDVFYFSGYAFDPRLDFNILVFTSSATLVATAAGYVGFVFDKWFALRAGYFSLPSARSMTGTYPWFHGTDRSMSTNYFRPGFTQGIWANNEAGPGFNYLAMIGNSLNTLDIKSVNIDNRFAAAATIWYDRADFGPYWNDYEHHDEVALRIGTSGTVAREDRLSDLSTAAPENNATFISDGQFLFQTGSLAPGVTIALSDHYLWAIDGGIKYGGFAFNVEFYMRWLNNFKADGPLPITSMFDWGFDSSIGYFFLRSLEIFGRSSLIHGPFATPIEGSIGFTWYPFGTRQVWINAEAVAIKDCPYAGGYYMYSVGQTGFVVPAQFLVRF
ncbi:MAG TPA: hypothetical protein VN903_36315 [Polyangia bacterium]|nr:hypothetical protein [Polyangia bacterium]